MLFILTLDSCKKKHGEINPLPYVDFLCKITTGLGNGADEYCPCCQAALLMWGKTYTGGCKQSSCIHCWLVAGGMALYVSWLRASFWEESTWAESMGTALCLMDLPWMGPWEGCWTHTLCLPLQGLQAWCKGSAVALAVLCSEPGKSWAGRQWSWCLVVWGANTLPLRLLGHALVCHQRTQRWLLHSP